MRSFVVSGCLTAVTDMAAVSLFWRSSGVLLGSSVLSNARRTPEERQKNARRTQKKPEERQKNARREKRETAAMSVTAVKQPETTNDFI